MKFLKSAAAKKSGFSAKFTNGETTTSHAAASFFMQMEEGGHGVEDLMPYIRMGRMVNPDEDWEEIKRIADTFTATAAA